MANAKKLPSGKWRVLVFDHTDSSGKRHYKSFTDTDRKRCEARAYEFQSDRIYNVPIADLTLSQAIVHYIDSSKSILSPTTISGYDIILRFAFQGLMNVKLCKITNVMLREAVNAEAGRIGERTGKVISAKTVVNEYGLISAVFHQYVPKLDLQVVLPQRPVKFKELPEPAVIFEIIKGTDIELPCLLAMWLSLSMSEIKGLYKSASIQDDFLVVQQVAVRVNREYVLKDRTKVVSRSRKHKIPSYIKDLIDNVETDQLVPMNGSEISHKFSRILAKNDIPHMTFHDLRHVNASVMAMLRIPDKYAEERGGWSSDNVMKRVYTHTFSDERMAVDQKIDAYFENSLGIVKDSKPDYDEWRKKSGLPDNDSIKKIYESYICNT